MDKIFPLLPDVRTPKLRPSLMIWAGVFIAGALGFGAYAFWMTFITASPASKSPLVLKNIPQDTQRDSFPENSAKPLEWYTAQMERDVFVPAVKNPVVSQVVEADIRDMGRDLRVVGIILDRKPQAIIEDTRRSETFFVRPQDHIGEMTVDEIQEGKVFLTFEDQKLELNP